MVRWVRISRFCELTGYTKDAVYTKIQRGHWLEGVLWKRAPDGNILMNLEAYEKWVEQAA